MLFCDQLRMILLHKTHHKIESFLNDLFSTSKNEKYCSYANEIYRELDE